MDEPDATSPTLDTTAGEFRLQEYRLRRDDREWTIFHTGAILSSEEEFRVISEKNHRLPYGVALWPSAIALVHEVVTRAVEFAGRSVLELGAGVGLPGIVAATLGARVVQTDRNELSMLLCSRNGERNGVSGIEHRLADWTEWNDTSHYDWIIGSDILYGESLHPRLRRIFETNLAPGGQVLLSDPFRGASLPLLEAMERDGWCVRFSKWDVGLESDTRPVGVFDLVPPK